MKLELEISQEIIEAITQRVVELLEPRIKSMMKSSCEDEILDVPGLAKYLGVDESWIYKQVSYKALPFYKIGKYTRFKKSAIDKWLEENKTPAISPSSRSSKEY